jgi:hypothetical protein
VHPNIGPGKRYQARRRRTTERLPFRHKHRNKVSRSSIPFPLYPLQGAAVLRTCAESTPLGIYG